jgi:glycosyltransferase involved in cell wall biosynthesis
MNVKNRLHLIALASLGQGLSGGDRIYIELSRRWSKVVPVTVYVWEEGRQMCRRENLSGPKLEFKLIKVGTVSKLGFVVTYFYRIFLGVLLGFSLPIDNEDYVFSASEFWMDALPAVIAKLRNKKVTWVAAWYQTAPNPLKGFAEGKRDQGYKMSAFLYWAVQLPIKPLIAHLADYVLVNNESEKNQFPALNQKGHAIVIIGAVDTERIEQYLKAHHEQKKSVDAVFQGRFHPQKGVIELIQIWKKVVNNKKDAHLVMIGNGPLMPQVKQVISENGLEKNIKLVGYLSDGEEKYDIFQKSRVVVHPAFYDSGGMASAEAMAFGLPCIGFDLIAYKSYYPKGMIKVPIGDLDAFSEMILKLLTDTKLYSKVGHEAKDLIWRFWSWNERAEQIGRKSGLL